MYIRRRSSRQGTAGTGAGGGGATAVSDAGMSTSSSTLNSPNSEGTPCKGMPSDDNTST